MTPEKFSRRARPSSSEKFGRREEKKSPGASTTSSPENLSNRLLLDFEEGIKSSKQSTPATSANLQGSAQKRQLRRKRRRISLSDEDEEGFNRNFEESIKSAALKNNLSSMCVKKVLRNIVCNEHVLAMVMLEDGEISQKLQANDSTRSNDTSDEDEDADDADDDKERPEPKLTRLKAKQLNIPLPIASLNEPAPDDEVAALIREELNSDDDDEEYKPTEDDIVSDDDPNTTVSDVESQPRTPASNAVPAELDTEQTVQYTKDGLFKIPKPRNDSQCSLSEQEQEQENIALRTRSKLCLTTTAIETLESTFIPPDITKDMYEYDGEMDQAWKDFLEEFTKPLPSNLEDDDDNDPEYVAAEGIPFDPEEMRTSKVSKKELNELVQELMEMGATDDQTLIAETLAETINESLDCQINSCTAMLSTPVPEEDPDTVQENSCLDDTIQPTMVASNEIPPEQFPVTTALPRDPSENELCPSMPSLDSPRRPYSLPVSTADYVPYETSHNTPTSSRRTQTSSAVRNLNRASVTPTSHIPTISNESYSQNVSYDQVIPQVGSDHKFFVKYSTLEEVPREAFPSTDQTMPQLYRTRSTTVPVEVNISEQDKGMNDFQFQLLQQQLRMHVQLTTQHYLQTYGHPKHYQIAPKCKTMLTELEEIGKTKPNVMPWNLPHAIDCCQSWENQLAVDDENTRSLMEFWKEEIAAEEHNKKMNRTYHSDFHWMLREQILNSKAFLYPSLLPYKAFRTIVTSKTTCSFNSEKLLIAMWLERARDALRNDTRFYSRRKSRRTKKEFPMGHICEYVAKRFCSTQTAEQLKTLVYRYRAHTGNTPNAITFFLSNGFAPPIQHTLESFDPNNVIPLVQYCKGTMHYNWEAYAFSDERVLRQQQPHYSSEHEKTIVCDEATQSCTPRDASTGWDINGLDTPYSEVGSVTCDALNGKLGSIVRVGVDEFVVSLVNPDQEDSAVPATVESDGETTEISTTESGISDGSVFTISNHSKRNIRRGNAQTVNHARSAATATLYAAMKRYLHEVKNEVKQELADSLRSVATSPVYRVYAHFKTLEIYSRFLDELRKMSENLAAYQYKPLPHCYFREAQAGLLRLSCSHRTDGSLIISAEYVTDQFADYRSMEDKDATYAFNYYEKVEETLLAAGRADLLERFEQILKNFDELEQRVSVLYYQIEDLLGEHFPQLVDGFLTFLLPGQAAEVGKFFEHFILTNMGDFLEKLNVFFAKQPSQIKKIHACLNELSNEPDVTMEQVKTKVLPLLKGSTLLTEWFLQLFPGERPPESPVCDYEHIGLKKHALNESFDAGSVFEHVSYVETVPEAPEIPCSSNTIRYIQGRIFDGALPARLTFLANNCLTKITTDQPASDETATTSTINLCDDTTLMAHAIRLNPLAHGAKGMTYADIVHLLFEEGEAEAGNPSENGIASTHAEDENRTASKKLTPKLPLKKRFNSPSPRKAGNSPGEEKSSPGAKDKDGVTPKRVTAASASVTIPPDSKALAASRKLKTLVDAPQQSSSQEERPIQYPSCIEQACNASVRPEEEPKRQTAPEVTSSSSSGSGGSSGGNTAGGSLVTDAGGSCSSNSNASVETRDETEVQKESNSIEAPSWTREEDKIILQDIIKGYSSVDMFVKQIEQKIPDRTSEQIRNRFEFLLRMLRQVKQK